MLREHREELYALSARAGSTLVRRAVRRRRRHRRAAGLRQQGQARTAQRTGLRRGPGRAAVQGRHVRRPAHPDAAARCRRAGQRLQLPGVGAAGEAGAGLHRGRPVADQARYPDRLPDRAAGRADRRVRACCPRARCSSSPAVSATCSTTSPSRTCCRSPARRRPRPRLRTHPTVVARAVRFNAEADSLNCSILGPDAAPGTAEFDLYVKQLVSEMTVKAGQKCTAIRRAFVPASMIDVGRRRGDRAAAQGDRGQSRPTPMCGWARWPASSSARRCAAR